MMHGSLPAKLQVLRARQGLTLIEAAEKIGIGRDTLSDLERGNRHPVMPTLAKIAKGYGVPVEDLLKEPEEEQPAPAGVAPQLNRGQFAEHGIEATEGEITVLNQILGAYTELAQTGAESTSVTFAGRADLERVYLLIDYALMRGILAPEDVAVLRDGVRARLGAGTS